jgi:hypothetical protein
MKPRHLISVILLVALLLAYPLSLGPVVRWYHQHPGNHYGEAIVTFYHPLDVFCDHVPHTREVIQQYRQLWVQD